MMDTSLPAGEDRPPLHTDPREHEWDHWFQERIGDKAEEHRSCVCGIHEIYIEHDDGHAGGHPHFCGVST